MLIKFVSAWLYFIIMVSVTSSPKFLMASSDNSMKSKCGTHVGSYIPLLILNSSIQISYDFRAQTEGSGSRNEEALSLRQYIL